ncbi:MAG TPA: SRPBCC domain-containing protein [Fibrobacteria bacterium]|nr:SRPBCC domain-containing protein [Fibrobacteria bacterium]
MTKSVTRELMFPQSRDEVWQALTDRASLAEWMYPNDFEARVGHRFTFHVPPDPQAKFDGLVVHCEVLECAPPEHLSFSWVVGDLNTRVDYRLEADGKGTKVFFEQSGFERENAYRGAGYGWNQMHGKLADLLARISAG